ncbi:unnamed protein product [Heligmosomoides polygyrus]|uniref:Helitron_like_N domain-containing protein n=1 Tax=Heligmosomoides polygyrus TaxID=6339 RepID=A0A183G748_HELPZ|nr:unnamed protein product [Heligmosomoides polygyrus]
MTCNPQWKEIQENLYYHQSASDRPDLVARVFNAKVKEFCTDLLKRHILGEVDAYVYVIEFQKRGLLHCHMLLIMKERWKARVVDDVDEAVCAELPELSSTLPLHDRIEWSRLRRRMGWANKFLFVVEIRMPNLEICGMISVVKYVDKYIYKGPDRAHINIVSNVQNTEQQEIDEIRQHLDTRYVCAPESLHRIFGFPIQDKFHTVCRLAVHLPDFQTMYVIQRRVQANQRREVEHLLNRAQNSFTTLTVYFELNARCSQGLPPGFVVDPRMLFYYQLPQSFTFDARNGWKPRLRGSKQIGRMYTVSPRDNERYSLRILLLNCKGKVSFEDLRTAEGRFYGTFTDAAKAAGFLDDDSYYRQSLEEAVQYQAPATIRSFFACLLCFCEVLHADELWNEFAEAMATISSVFE